jgi:amidase
MRHATRSLAAAMVAALTAAAAAGAYDVEEKPIAQLQADMIAGVVTAEALVEAYLGRIDSVDRAGGLNSVIVINPDARGIARALDAERAAGKTRGPLHGIPVLVKDNIDTLDPMPTTAGSLALAENLTGRDSPLVARLRAAGAIILGKTNLSEWANIRSSASVSGWSAAGGQTRNPYALDRSPCGSSSGSGAAAAASLAAATIGTETDGSIICPAALSGLAGLKPTVGLVSRTHIVPISISQDTAGPMGRSVADIAAILTVIAGSDPSDAATQQADARKEDYSAALSPDALKGKRIGVLRFQAGFHRDTARVFETALTGLEAAGAVLVEIKDAPDGLETIRRDELTILLAELKTGLAAYLATTPPAVKVRTLADVIAFNRATQAEMPFFDQELFERAEATGGMDDPAYKEAASAKARAASILDRLLADNGVDALIAPPSGPAWTIDLVNGDAGASGGATMLPAVAGYPHVTVTMGDVRGLPVGLSFIGPAWSEARLLSFAYAFEQQTKARRAPAYPATLGVVPE